nr:hypothetical protein [Tanacetum cinerariifolium]
MEVDAYCDEIDHVLSCLAQRNTVKKLKLLFDRVGYTLTLSVFLFCQLTELCLKGCYVKPPPTIDGFGSLTRLSLQNIYIFDDTRRHLLSKCRFLKSLTMGIHAYHVQKSGNEDSNIINLFECLPVVETLYISFSIIQLFESSVHGRIPRELPTALIHLKYLNLNCVVFHHKDVFSVLVLVIKSSSNLEKLKIDNRKLGFFTEGGLFTHDDICSFSLKDYADIWLEHLNELHIRSFRNKGNELNFVKLILAKSPMLKKVTQTSVTALRGAVGVTIEFFISLRDFSKRFMLTLLLEYQTFDLLSMIDKHLRADVALRIRDEDTDEVADNEEPKKEEEPIPEQAPAAPDGFAPQWIGRHDLNNNRWIEEDDEEMEEEDDEDIKEEDDEEMEDEEEEEIVAEDEAEIIYPYDEADPNNRPPPALDDESEFAPSVIPVFDAENRPVPPVIDFSSTGLEAMGACSGEGACSSLGTFRSLFGGGESSSAREILKDIGEVYPFGLIPLTIGTAMRRIRKLNEQIHKRAEVDERIVKKIDRSNLRIRMVGRDAMSLDGTARNAAMADNDVEDDDVEDDDDMDDDAANPSDLYYNYTNGMITYSLLFSCHVRIMPHKQMSQAVIAKLVADEVAKAPAADRAARNATVAGGSGNFGGVAIELCRWFKKIERTFGISECAERNKVKFDAATLQEELCPKEEISRMDDELRHLRLKDNDIAAYTNRFNKLVLLCPDVVPFTKKKIGQYIKGLLSYIKGETYASKPTTLNKAGVATGANAEPIRVCFKREDKNHLANSDLCPERKKQGGRNESGHVYAVRDAKQPQGPNVVTGTFLLNKRYFSMLFDSGSDKSFINTSLTYLFDIEPERISTSYEVELAGGRIVSTNTVLKGCTLNLVNHLCKIDLMPIELVTFDAIISMYWLVALDAVIVCGKKEVHISVKNQTLVVKGDSNSSRLKVISCIKARKYIERGCHLFLAHVTEKDRSKKRLEDVPSKEEHSEHIKIILDPLKKEKLYAKFSKCDFWWESVQFLGHVINSEGVHIDPAIIKAIKNWPTPTSPTEVRQFMGLAGYYKRFIEEFSLIAKPLTKLTQKNKKFEWGADEDEAFQKL